MAWDELSQYFTRSTAKKQACPTPSSLDSSDLFKKTSGSISFGYRWESEAKKVSWKRKGKLISEETR